VTHVIAHRGASRDEPENTVAAFRRAVALGSDGVELDVRRSAGGHLIVLHEPFLPDGRFLEAVPLDELPPSIPTLAAALDACAGVAVNVEIKNDPVEPDFDPAETLADDVVALLRARPEPPRTWLVSSFRLATVDRVRALAPELATAYLTLACTPDELGVTVAAGHAAIHPWEASLEEAGVAEAHRLGLRVNTWTCNDPERARELAGWGVDGIVTDVPDLIRSALARPTPT
jgi:glycerophosphoryl diester phosphodiesterase